MIWVPTAKLRYKVANAFGLKGRCGGDWDIARHLLADTAKHKSMVQHFVDELPWEETDLFRDIYPQRFALGGSVRGASTMQGLIAQYYREIDGLFRDLKERGFLYDGVSLPTVVIGRDGGIMLWNQGNHRVAMAKIIGIEQIPCDVICRWQK